MRFHHCLIAAAIAGLSAIGHARAQSLDAQRPQFRAALEAVDRGDFDAARYAGLRSHPAWPWLEYAALNRGIDTLPEASARDFLQRYDGQPVADVFRSQWLAALAKRKDWPAFLAAWRPRDGVALRCAELQARLAAGKADAAWTADAQAIWRSSGKSLPDACDPAFDALAARGGLTPELRWERIDLAAAEGQAAVMRRAARGLPADEAALATDYAAFIDAPHPRALNWPKTARSRKIAMNGLMLLARRDPAAAERLLPQYAAALDETGRNNVLYQIALWSVASYLPDSARRLDAVPAAAYDERLHEWRVREALSRGDWPAALAALRRMPATQREDARWRYFEARMAEKAGDAAGARKLYAEAAKTPTFHGFLAADRLGQPYALCPLPLNADPKTKAAVAADPGIVRALELWKLARPNWAIREWDAAVARFDDAQRKTAVEVARDNGWFDRAVFSLSKSPDEQRLYELRFPLHHADSIRREAAKNALDPAWVAAEIRAESIFDPNARSQADARGLMQVLPSTGAAVARRIGLPWSGGDGLYDADANIAIGSAYLREVLDKYGAPYLAIAAYNAGPTPTARWLSQRPGFDPDVWIETISYKETREYVARVLAFSVLYDWRMNGDALPLSERLLGRNGGTRKAFACPVVDPTPK
ncbi:MAG: transglycosylase SLT domain-containing protein [Pseudoxanthomonas sp.]